MNKEHRIAVVFPAFVTEFIGNETDELSLMGTGFPALLKEAVPVCGEEILSFDIRESAWLQDELKIQYITYIFSCAFSEILRKNRMTGDLAAGYSMGIYAALYHAGCIRFTEGLLLIREAFNAIKNTLPGGAFTMGLTGGLEMHDVDPLLKKYAPGTYIINSNNRHTFVYSGPAREIEALIGAAKEEGALMTRIMNVSVPYHAPYLTKAAEVFAGTLDNIDWKKPQQELISSLSLKPLLTVEDIRQEVTDNLHHPFHWYETIRIFLDRQTDIIIECGAGEGLTKINKFIPGDYKTINLKQFRRSLLAG